MRRTLIVTVTGLGVLVLGALLTAQDDKYCAGWMPVCYPYECFQTGQQKCKDNDGNEQTFNRIVQTRLDLGHCYPGPGFCDEPEHTCETKKYFVMGLQESCTAKNLKCTASAPVSGCHSG